MFSIYICEDNLTQLEEMQKIIQNEITIHELDMKIEYATTSPSELLKNIEQNAYPSIYFLDMDLSSDYNGLTLASKIREFDSFGSIIFVTSYDIYMPITFQYQLGATDYILKHSIDKNLRITKCLHTILKRYEKADPEINPVLTLSVGKSIIVIPICEVSHIVTSDFPHKVVVYTLTGFHEASGTLKEMETFLDENFLRCHKNCIINLKQIKEIDISKRIITMKNGFKCEYSIRCKKELLGTVL